MKKRKIIIGVCFFALLGLTVAMPFIDYALNGEVTSKSILGTIALFVGDFLFLIKNVVAYSSPDKKTFEIYESDYKDIIGNAFLQDECKKDRVKLLKAIHLYNQNKFNLSIEMLNKLIPKCQLSSDRYAVLTFIALNYTDMGAYSKAVETYERLLRYDISKSDAWSNLGYVYKKMGDFEKQMECYSHAIENNGKNAYAFNNMAQGLFSAGYYEDAIPYAERALELKPNLHPAASCLALCHCALGNDEECEHYSKIAISNGTSQLGLNTLINNLRAARKDEKENLNEEKNDE